MREVDLYSGMGRDVVRSAGALDSVTLTRPETRVESRGPGAREQELAAGVILLKKQLQKQTEAVLDATQTVALLNSQVLSAQTELKSARHELEVQKQARTSESARMAWRLSRLQEEHALAANHALADRETLSKQRNIWCGVAAAGMIALTILCVVGWRMKLPSADALAARGPSTRQGSDLAQHNSRNINALPADPEAALTTGFDHLNDALDAVPGVNAQETLRKASANGQNCGIVWTNNLPSLLFTGKPAHPNSLANTLEDCAQAVSKVH